ncbi:hypothetical protein BFX40_10755 [Mesorhizobium sp. SEMIA 3007]|nr:hypothetical protein BFX40_10755 [Mesorhizobium sp. SEMIA 3007]
MMLAKLGLRGSEVAALRLDDIDWRSGKMLVHGQGTGSKSDISAANSDSGTSTNSIGSKRHWLWNAVD